MLLTTQTRKPPGPRGLPLVGVAPQIARDPYGSFQQIARRYGDVASVPVPGMDLVLVSHPDHVKHVTNTKHAIYPKPALLRDILYREPPRFHGMANGEEWKRVRRMLNPRFTARGLAPLEELIIDAIVDSVDGWERYAASGEQVDIQEQFSLLTMSVMLRSMFTRPAPPEEIERLAASFVDLMRGMAISMLTTPLPAWAPRPFARRYEQAKDDICAYIDAMVAERRANPIPDGDLLSMVLDGEFDDGTTMDDEHIRRELMGLIFGGYETTAAVLSWVIARLPPAPDVQARAYDEVDALGGGRVTHDDLERLEWTRACFDECQSLQAFAVNAREATVDDEIGGYEIPAGTTVAFSGQTLHRDPRWWREPERFDPSRFLDEETNSYAFLPFGVGPRRCLGMKMAYMVGLWTLASAFQRYRFELPPGWRPQPRFVFSSVVKGGVPVTIHRRA
jgi:cytochrome P450